jgi:hypothetical protein
LTIRGVDQNGNAVSEIVDTDDAAPSTTIYMTGLASVSTIHAVDEAAWFAGQERKLAARHPLAALVRYIEAGDVPIVWVIQHEARWEEIWRRARLVDRMAVNALVRPRLHRHAVQWADRAGGEGRKSAKRRTRPLYLSDPWPRTWIDHVRETDLGAVYKRIAPPTLAECIGAARRKREGNGVTR